MAESLKEVLARMKNKQGNSQKSNPKPKEVIKDAEDDYVDEDETMELKKDQIVEKEQEKAITEDIKQEVDAPMDKQIAMQIEMLQNDGLFRVELLNQLQEINKALVVIAGSIVDLSGKNGL